jgi:hypothetical protein
MRKTFIWFIAICLAVLAHIVIAHEDPKQGTVFTLPDKLKSWVLPQRPNTPTLQEYVRELKLQEIEAARSAHSTIGSGIAVETVKLSLGPSTAPTTRPFYDPNTIIRAKTTYWP